MTNAEEPNRQTESCERESENASVWPHPIITRRKFFLAALASTFLTQTKMGYALGKQGIPLRTLGRTGEKVSMIGLGGYHAAIPSESETISIIRTAIDEGITFMDNCWDYHGGASESRMGKALRGGYRDKVFLMTKIDGRTRKAAARQIDECLKRLQTDRIDLMQIHEVIRDRDPEACFGKGGAMEALFEAKKAGKIRYIGFTGHKSPAIHLKMLEVAFQHDFTFDAVQLPLSVLDAHYDSFEQKVLPVLNKHKIAALAMKTIGCGAIPRSGTVSGPDCLRYALSLPVSVVITGCDSMEILKQAVNVARTFVPLSADERKALLDKTSWVAKSGVFELYKSTQFYDGTTHHPEWLG
jgi:aryl-alcohol dehydrogenase-like predicted oxidoreductase